MMTCFSNMASIQMNEWGSPCSKSTWPLCMHTWNTIVISIMPMSDSIVLSQLNVASDMSSGWPNLTNATVTMHTT